MSLLTIAQAVFDEIQLEQQSTIAGNGNVAARRLLRYANSVGQQIARDGNWRALRFEHTFNATAAELQANALPADFERFVPGTFYNRTTNEYVVGPIGADEWQSIKAQGDTSSEPRFIHRQNEVRMTPTPTAGDDMAFEYMSSHWCQDTSGTGQTAFAADTDTARIDEELLIMRIASVWLTSEGLPAGGQEDRYRQRMRDLSSQDQARRRVMPAGDIFGGSRHWNGQPPSGGSRNNLWI